MEKEAFGECAANPQGDQQMKEIKLYRKTWQEVAFSLIEQLTLLEIRVAKLENRLAKKVEGGGE